MVQLVGQEHRQGRHQRQDHVLELAAQLALQVLDQVLGEGGDPPEGEGVCDDKIMLLSWLLIINGCRYHIDENDIGVVMY